MSGLLCGTRPSVSGDSLPVSIAKTCSNQEHLSRTPFSLAESSAVQVYYSSAKSVIPVQNTHRNSGL